jgi:ribosomal protein L9
MASKDDDSNKQDNSEDFGLPNIEYKPLDQPGENAPREEAPADSSYSAGGGRSTPTDSNSYVPEESGSRAPVVLGIIIALVVVVAGYLIYNFVIKPNNAEKARKEAAAREQQRKQQQEAADRAAKQKADEEERRRQEALANAKPTVGTIETLNGRTRRYYVVVTSDIDDDLLMDFAKKLSVKGVSTKIIPPFGDKKFYRLAIADHDTFDLAQKNANDVKADYGGAVWVLKY